MSPDEPPAESNESLLLKAGSGDSTAFGQLYDRISAPLYRLMIQILGNAADAEEVLQEGFVYLWKQAASYDPKKAKVFTWAVMIFRNKAIDRLRSRRKQEHIASAAEAIAGSHALSHSALAPDEASVANERARCVLRALEEIPTDQRQCIERAFLTGESHEAIARHTGRPLGTVKTNIRRGLARLRDIIKGGVR